MFGGGGGQEMRPQYVLNEWSLATDLMKDFKGTVCQAWHSMSCTPLLTATF